MRTIIRKAVEYIELRASKSERLAIVLGSGLGGLVELVTDKVVVPYTDIPGFPVSTVASHAGEMVLGQIGGLDVVLMSGRIHYYEDGNPAAMMVPLEVLWEMGCRTLLLTNAAGSVHENVPPASAALITDHINFSGLNPLIGDHRPPQFLDLGKAYDPEICERIRAAGKTSGAALHEGVYVWYSGPSFETPAEIKMIRLLGGDLVGMSTVPEVLLARKQGFRLGAISLVTNYAAGMRDEELSHAHTMREAERGADNMLKLFSALIADLQKNPLSS
ncbi:Purine nucleoside phosphorylase [hydrothermal vent metagenome]|uniref:purine-nucleoside phosphorylase n=1 Tax=hydrothermal vent metagenome TaxID=652676 RepID=A0A3B0RVV5_9ZZZZ